MYKNKIIVTLKCYVTNRTRISHEVWTQIQLKLYDMRMPA